MFTGIMYTQLGLKFRWQTFSIKEKNHINSHLNLVDIQANIFLILTNLQIT